MAYFDTLSLYTADNDKVGVEVSISKTELAKVDITVYPDRENDFGTIYWNGSTIWGEKKNFIDAQGHTFKLATNGTYNLDNLPEKGSGDGNPLTSPLINILTPKSAYYSNIDYTERGIQKKDSTFKIYVRSGWAFGEETDFVDDSTTTEVKSRIHSYLFDRINGITIGTDLKINFSNVEYPSLVHSLPKTLPSLVDDSNENNIYSVSGKSYTLPLPKVDKTATYRFTNNYTYSTDTTDKHNVSMSVVADLFDDTLIVQRGADLSKPVVYRNNNVLSWGKVSNAKVYQIYKDNVKYTTTTGTSFTIPNAFYYGEVHDWSIEALDSYTLSCVATHYKGSDNSDIYAQPKSTLKVYKQSSLSYWNNVGYVYAPIVKTTRNALNSYSINVSDSTNNSVNVSLKYKIDNGTTKTVSNNVINLTSLKPNTKYSYEIWAVGENVESSHITGSFTTVKASVPTVSNAVRTEFNAYQITFSSIKNSVGSGIKDNVGTGVDRFDVYRNGIIYKSNATSPITVDGLKCNSENKIKIVSVFEKDASFNSEYTYTLDASKTPRLTTPTIRKENVYENNVEVQFGSSKEISKEPICTSINLKWDAIEFASGYLLRDEYREFDNDKQDYVEGVRYYPTQEEGQPTEYLTTTTYNIPMNNVKGYHLYTIQAIATDRVYNDLDKKSEYYIDEEYSSAEQTGTEDERTDQVRADMNFPLNAPLAHWDANTTTVSFEPVPNADFYSIQLVPTYETTNVLWRSFRLEPGQEIFTYNYYDMVKDLKATEHFIATIIARSYNAFYFHPSADSTRALDSEDQQNSSKIPLPGDVYVYKLNTPTELDLFTENEGDQRLSWKWKPSITDNYTGALGEAQITPPYGYEVGIKPIDDEWVIKRPDGLGVDKYPELEHNFESEIQSFLFPKMGQSLFTFQVKAIRDNTKTNHQPVFLDSDYIISSKGTLAQPQNFQRFVNRFTWSDAGDNVTAYVLWDNYTPDPAYLDELREQGIKEEDLPYKGLRSIVTVDGGLFTELGMEEDTLHRAEPGRHIYQIQGIATIRGVKYSSSIYQEEPEYGDRSLEEIKSLYDNNEITKDEYDSLVLYKKHTIYCDVKYLKQVVPYYINSYESIVEWEALDDEVQYETTINGLSEKDMQLERQYTINSELDNLYDPGAYVFSVRARSTVDEFLNQRSLWSEELPYNVIQLSRPDISKKVSLDDRGDKIYNFSWNSVANATRYKMYHTYVPNNDIKDENGNIIIESGKEYHPEEGYVEGTSKDIFLGAYPGAHSVFITAVSLTNDLPNPTNYPRPRYMESENSEIFNFGVLERPEITNIDGEIGTNVITWEPVKGADYYSIYNHRGFYAQTEENKFIIDLNAPYSYSISVTAESLDEDTVASNFSNSIEFTVSKLPKPERLKITGNSLTWNRVANADMYAIYANNSLIAMPIEASYDLSAFLSESAGFITFTVAAISDGSVKKIINEKTPDKPEWVFYLESDKSNSVIKSIRKEKKYNIVINGVNYDDIQLPFTIHKTLDETLDDAQLTLAYLDRKKPFERLTPATLIIYESNQPSQSYDMLIEADVVEEVQIGTQIKYKHGITLIERTLKLQNEPVPNFTVSKSKIREILKLDEPTKITPDFGGYRIPGGNFGTYTAEWNGPAVQSPEWALDQLDLLHSIKWDYKGDFARNEIDIFGISDTILGSVNNEYSIGSVLQLPMPQYKLTSLVFDAEEKDSSMWDEFLEFFGGIALMIAGVVVTGLSFGLAAPLGAAMIIAGAGLTVAGYIDLAVESDGEQTKYSVRNTLADSKWPYPARKYYIRKAANKYEKDSKYPETLIGEVDFNIENNETVYYPLQELGKFDIIMEIPTINYQNLADRGMLPLGDFFEGEEKPSWPTNIDLMKDSEGNLVPYRVVWKNIEVKQKVATKETGTKISWVLEKICELVNQNKTTNEKYKIHPDILTETNNMICPDLTFSHGKYMYEVLEEIGREFNGIPRLLKDNIITFDILDKTTEADTNLSFWMDKDLLQKRKQDIELSSSGFISNVSNMVPEEDYTIYPSYNMWSYPRGDNYAAVIDVSNLAIVLDKPIYQIESVKVKNALIIEGQTSTLEIDITDYVYESTVYNALNAGNGGKGMALCWSQGDNKIVGLGQLPEVVLSDAAKGLSSEEYVINNIIQDWIDKQFKDSTIEKPVNNTPDKMLFQVKYRGYIDTTMFIENPDKKDDTYKMYSYLNQDANTISDKRFGDSALTQLKRHGNEIIEKSYITAYMLYLPRIGHSAKIDDDVFYIDDVTYIFNNETIQADCKFSKNNSKINPRVALSTEYRQYELQADNNVDRDINFNQFCTLGSAKSNDNKNFAMWKSVLEASLTKKTYYLPDTFYFNCYNNNSEARIPYLTTEDTTNIGNKLVTKQIEGIALPTNYARIGTSVQFSTRMADSFCAGQAVRRAGKKQINNDKGDLVDDPKDLGLLQSWVRYVGDDSTDQTPYMRLSIGSLPNSLKTDAYQLTYPSVKWYSNPTVEIGNTIFSKKFKVYKDQRERLGFNYQMHFLSNKSDLFIHKGFTKYLFIKPETGKEPSRAVSPILVAYNGNIGHKTDLQNHKFVKDISINSYSGFINCSSNTIADRNYDGLAVIWPDTKEIMLELRKPIKKGEKLSYGNIYYNFSNNILS